MKQILVITSFLFLLGPTPLKATEPSKSCEEKYDECEASAANIFKLMEEAADKRFNRCMEEDGDLKTCLKNYEDDMEDAGDLYDEKLARCEWKYANCVFNRQ